MNITSKRQGVGAHGGVAKYTEDVTQPTVPTKYLVYNYLHANLAQNNKAFNIPQFPCSSVSY